MEALIMYLVKSLLCAGLFLGIYWCFFRNETFYRFNRYFLLAGLVLSIVLPFYTYTYAVAPASESQLFQSGKVAPAATGIQYQWPSIILMVYAAGIVFLLIRHIAGIMKIKRAINRYGYTSRQGHKLVNMPDFGASFSVFNYIIIDNSLSVSDTEKELVLEHELAHVKQMHWIDLLIAQAFCAMQWFNPLAWLYLHFIKQNHEYLADNTVLKQGNSAALYRAVLINHSLNTPVFTFASSFSHYDKLKRIKMMMRPASGQIRKIAVVVTLPALTLIFLAFAKPEISPKPANVTIKHAIAKQPLVLIDNEEVASADVIAPGDIESIDILKDGAAIEAYGEKGKNGVIRITSKKK